MAADIAIASATTNLGKAQAFLDSAYRTGVTASADIVDQVALPRILDKREYEACFKNLGWKFHAQLVHMVCLNNARLACREAAGKLLQKRHISFPHGITWSQSIASTLTTYRGECNELSMIAACTFPGALYIRLSEKWLSCLEITAECQVHFVVILGLSLEETQEFTVSGEHPLMLLDRKGKKFPDAVLLDPLLRFACPLSEVQKTDSVFKRYLNYMGIKHLTGRTFLCEEKAKRIRLDAATITNAAEGVFQKRAEEVMDTPEANALVHSFQTYVVQPSLSQIFPGVEWSYGRRFSSVCSLSTRGTTACTPAFIQKELREKYGCKGELSLDQTTFTLHNPDPLELCLRVTRLSIFGKLGILRTVMGYMG